MLYFIPTAESVVLQTRDWRRGLEKGQELAKDFFSEVRTQFSLYYNTKPVINNNLNTIF